eukprot:2774563-Pyramimonas_sp.AAC.1
MDLCRTCIARLKPAWQWTIIKTACGAWATTHRLRIGNAPTSCMWGCAELNEIAHDLRRSR